MDKYNVIKKIGKGSFGHALLVKNTQIQNKNNLFVIKVINIKQMNKK